MNAPLRPEAAVLPRPDVRALRVFGAGVLVFAATVGLLATGLGGERVIGLVGFGGSAGLAVVGIGLGLRALARRPSAGLATLTILGPVLGGGAMALFGAFLALWATAGFRRGRQLRRRGRIFLPTVGAGAGWSKVPLPEVAAPAVLADLWRDNGRTEHASVGAFAHLTLDLMALGAPSKLLMAAQRDAADEVRHAELCFSLARSLDGRDLGPEPFPEARRARSLSGFRTLALAHLAVDSLIDGAFHEGLSARMIAKLAKRCEVPAITAILKELAADEGRHAASGWDVVEWCLAQGGRPVRAALQGAGAALPAQPPERAATAASDGSLEVFGLHGDRLEREEYAKMRDDVLRRLAALLGARAAA